MKKLYILLLLGNIAHAKDKIAAEVNGEKITKIEVESQYKQQLLYPSHKKITMDTVLQNIINKRLGVQKAKALKLDQEEYVQARFDDILHNALVSDKLEEKFAKITITDKEVADYYKTNKEYRTSQILYRVRAVPSKEEVTKALGIMGEINKELKKTPSKFEEMAKKHSQIATNKSAGDIGFLPPTSMSPEYFEAIKGKKIGFISEPIRTQFGFHIIKLTGVKPFDKIDKKLYKKIIFDIKRDKIISDYYASLRKGGKVKVYK